MRQKELRIALICYGGISLAVYMHGVTKEVWRATRASRGFLEGTAPPPGVEGIYRALLAAIERDRALRVRVLTDIVAGASAGGINGVFLSQAIASGQSLEPLTSLWLEKADVDVLLDPDARPFSRFSKFWAQPLVWFMLKRPGNVVSSTVAPETRAEVRLKLSRLIRARWFAPPFSGIGFTRLIADALETMDEGGGDGPLLPPGHPLDLFVTATDFNGHAEVLRLNSPPVVEESEHRLSIGFRAVSRRSASNVDDLAPPPELIMAARATASFPGAFPPLTVAEIDRLADERGIAWPGRSAFLARIMPHHTGRGDVDQVSLVDGSVLVNAPFSQAIAVLRDRPAQREVDRRIVYIDPRPDRNKVEAGARANRHVGFFAAIAGSLSSIPREQPIRDNLEAIAEQSREMAKMRGIVEALRPEVDEAVEHLFGRTLSLYRPTARRLTAWRAKAQQAAAERAGFAFHAYAQTKAAGIVEQLSATIAAAMGGSTAATRGALAARIWQHLHETGLDRMASLRGGATAPAITFFRAHDLPFRIRRLRLLARRLAVGWADLEDVAGTAREAAREAVFAALARYIALEPLASLGEDFASLADGALDDPGPALDHIARTRDLAALDLEVDRILADAMATMPRALRRRVMLTYLGFPFYDVATLPLLRGEGLNEYDPVKVDRISPEDCGSIRKGGTAATLRGVEFFSFGAFFSRAYRENDYLWGRLHGAERVIDLIASTVEEPLDAGVLADFKRRAFLAILDEEEGQLQADPTLVGTLRGEVEISMAPLARPAPAPTAVSSGPDRLDAVEEPA
ncbi:patatin-like protein [Novosphingobium tardum]|uniref:Patatin-like protein n=1 Tax=Novosphingobium tardum TaxID=1538021 RepID=A0ABV8RPZ2_9SPHN